MNHYLLIILLKIFYVQESGEIYTLPLVSGRLEKISWSTLRL